MSGILSQLHFSSNFQVHFNFTVTEIILAINKYRYIKMSCPDYLCILCLYLHSCIFCLGNIIGNTKWENVFWLILAFFVNFYVFY